MADDTPPDPNGPDTSSDEGRDDDASSSGSDGDDARTFTQDEVNRIVKDRAERLVRQQAGGADLDEVLRKAGEFDRLEEERKSELEKAVDKASKEAEQRTREELEPVWKRRLIRSEVRTLAAGKLADPNDAISLLDLDDLEIDDDGNLDEEKVRKRIEKLLDEKPYLAANGARRRPDFDAGSRTPAPGGEDVNARIRRAAGVN